MSGIRVYCFVNPNLCVSVLFKPEFVSWGLWHLYVIKEQTESHFAFVLTDLNFKVYPCCLFSTTLQQDTESMDIIIFYASSLSFGGSLFLMFLSYEFSIICSCLLF